MLVGRVDNSVDVALPDWETVGVETEVKVVVAVVELDILEVVVVTPLSGVSD